MREIIPSILWIGNAQDARDIKRVLAAEFRVVIDLAIDEPAIQFPRDIVYCRFPLLDGEGNSPAILQSAIETTTNFVRDGQRTLVACSGGMSRSPEENSWTWSGGVRVSSFKDISALTFRGSEVGFDDVRTCFCGMEMLYRKNSSGEIEVEQRSAFDPDTF